MDIRKILNVTMIVLGIAALVIGLFGIFGTNVTKQSPWLYTILGTVFFSWGMMLLKAFDSDDHEIHT